MQYFPIVHEHKAVLVYWKVYGALSLANISNGEKIACYAHYGNLMATILS